MTETKKRRRHVASDEAHAWARSLPLDNPNAKNVLRALAIYVNGEGCCFVGIDQLSEDTDLSPDTVRRRLVWLEQIGTIVRIHQWLDANGRRNGDGKGKRTSDEIRLLLDADIDEIERRAKGDNMAPEGDEPAISPSSQQGLNQAPETPAETVSPTLALGQPSQCCEGLISEPEPESSPQPPSGGSVDLEGWKEFEEDWQEPIVRQSFAEREWAKLTPEQRALARQAARGYVAHRRSQAKPANVIGAHLFLKEPKSWPKFAALAPEVTPVRSGIPSDSTEAEALRSLYAVARCSPFEHKGRVVHRGEITPQILAFANAGPPSGWAWITAGRSISAWANFLDKHVQVPRPPLVRDAVGLNEGRGIFAPWLYPPSVEGKPYPITGPPGDPAEMSSAEADEFR